MAPIDFFLNFFEVFLDVRKIRSPSSHHHSFLKILGHQYWDWHGDIGAPPLDPNPNVHLYKRRLQLLMPYVVLLTDFIFLPELSPLSSSSSRSSSLLEHPRDLKKKIKFSLWRSLQASTSKEPDLHRSSCGRSIEAGHLCVAVSNLKGLSPMWDTCRD